MTLASCSTESYDGDHVKARVYEVFYISSLGEYVNYSTVEFKYVDRMAKKGDLIKLDDTTYRVDSILNSTEKINTLQLDSASVNISEDKYHLKTVPED